MTQDLPIPVFRTSERGTFDTCWQKWWWAWREGLRPNTEDRTALWFGTGVHLALAEWYCGPGLKRGPHPADTFEDYVGDQVWAMNIASEKEDAKYIDAKDLGVAMLEGYVDKYGADDSWSIIAPEQAFQVNIPNLSGKGILGVYAGTFDLIYRDLTDNKIYLGEHKTAKAIRTGHLPLDNQAGSYWLIAPEILQHSGLLKKGEVIGGINYNFLKKSLPDDRPQDAFGRKLNKNGTVSKRQPGSLFEREMVLRDQAERRSQLRRIQNELSWMNLARKYPDRITKSPSTNCEFFCEFHNMCVLHERGGNDWKEYRRAMFHREDPYADHRKSTEG